MSAALNTNTLLVKEHVGLFKAANNFDIFDATNGDALMDCRETNLGLLTKLLRFTDFKRHTPFEIETHDTAGNLIVKVKREISLLRSKVTVIDSTDHLIGSFQQKLLSVGGAFTVLNEQEHPICKLTGKWTGWDFTFTRDDTTLAHVTKKWNGIGKELFTSADNYVIEISDAVPPESNERKLILAAVLCIDMVLKE